MSNCLKLEVTLQDDDNQLNIYLRDGVKPLIEALRSENELIHFDLALNRHERSSIVVGLLVKTLSVDDVLKRIDFQFNNLSDDHRSKRPVINVGQIVDSDNVIPCDEPNSSIMKAVSSAMLEAFSQEEMDDDLVFTFGIYLLFAAYSSCSAALPSVAKAVYENFMAKTEVATLATDRIFHSIKHHVMKPTLDEVYGDITRSKKIDQLWLHNFINDIDAVLANVKSEGDAITPFIAFSDRLRAQLGLNALSTNLLNYFVFQTLVKPELTGNPVKGEISRKASVVTKPQRSNSQKIPLLTYYSPSHKSLFDNFFFPSYKKHLSTDFELIVLNGEQLCAALFEEDNWNRQVKEKIIFLNEFIQKTENDYVVFSDVDIIFYKNIYNQLMGEIAEHDMAFQNDSLYGLSNNLCSGFYCCRVNASTKAFFKKMVDEYQDALSDQQNLNLLLPKVGGLRYKELSSLFYNFSHADGRIWFSNERIAFPQRPIVMYHANYAVGTTSKEFLLRTFVDWDNLFF